MSPEARDAKAATGTGTELAPDGRLQEAEALLRSLSAEVTLGTPSNPPSQPEETLAKLERLKVLGRQTVVADGIVGFQDGVKILCRLGFRNGDDASRREALRCLANTLLLVPRARQVFVDLKDDDGVGGGGYAGKATTGLSAHTDEQFLCARILFLLTYNTDLDFEHLNDEYSLADTLEQTLSTHAASAQHAPAALLALSELLKLVFNITHHFPSLVPALSNSAAPILNLLLSTPTKPPLQPITPLLLNALLNLPLSAASLAPILAPSAPTAVAVAVANAESLIAILDSTISTAPPDTALSTLTLPILTLLRALTTHAPAASPVGAHLRRRLLPLPSDRAAPLGHGPSLAARLLRLATSPVDIDVKRPLELLLWELSDADPARFVDNIGFGNAAGFLAARGIAVPRAGGRRDRVRGEYDDDDDEGEVDFVTGQRRTGGETGGQEEMVMSEEEKMREAERLFVLFERLKATGVVDVQNPVEEALRSGRFEELDD